MHQIEVHGVSSDVEEPICHTPIGRRREAPIAGKAGKADYKEAGRRKHLDAAHDVDGRVHPEQPERGGV